MGYRQIFIKQSYRLSLKNNSLCIRKEENNPDCLYIPLEDISSILIEDPHTILTVKILTELANYGIAAYLCNEQHLPITQILPLNRHYNQLAVYNKQIALSKHTKEKLWQKIIKAKIYNQFLVSKYTSNDNEINDMLEKYSKTVKMDDKDNREGIASKIYFTGIFGNGFIRFSGGNISNALDYGYTVFNNSLVRLIVNYGLNTYLGIWHQSEKNAFNLASDLIEPFRPLVDYFAYWNQNYLDFPLTTNNRRELVNLLNKKVIIDNKSCSAEYAMEVTVKSFLKVLETNDPEFLLLPKIEGVNFINEEYI